MAGRHEGNGPRARSARRVAGAAGCLGAAAVVAAKAASAGFTGAVAVDQTGLTAGNVYLEVPGYPAAPAGGQDTFVANRMELAVDGLYPLNTYRERVIDVKVAGNVDLATLTMSVVAQASNELVTDANGLGMIVDLCSTGWTEAGSSPDYTYTCGGVRTELVGTEAGTPDAIVDVAPNGTNPTVHSLTTGSLLTAGSVNHLRIRYKLAAAAPNALQGQSNVLTFTFDGTARAGTNR